MITVNRATELVAAALPPTEVESVPLSEASGRVLAGEVVAGRDDPALDVSAMDGYAVRMDCPKGGDAAGAEWTVAGVAAAGAPRTALVDPALCVEIGTGAPVPGGADTVVPVERVAVSGNRVTPAPGEEVAPGSHIRRRGSNYRKGEVLLSPGSVISPVQVAVLAAEGYTEVPVYRRLRAALISSGSELVDPWEEPEEHQIRGSNLPALVAQLHTAGFEIGESGQVKDDPDQIRRRLARLLSENDILVLTGGASRGRYDLVGSTLAELGAEILFHWVAQKPGKPLLAARFTHQGGRSTLILGLPGNPQAAIIDCRRYLVEALYAQQRPGHRPLRLPLAETVSTKKGKTLFLPVRREQGPHGAWLMPVESTGSGDYLGLSRSTGFAELSSDSDQVSPGELVPYYSWVEC